MTPPPTHPTSPSDATRQAETDEARQAAGPDRPPTPSEERAAEAHQPDPAVARHEQEMLERGADQEGEGQLP